MTQLQISADLSYRLPAPCTILVQLAAAATAQQRIDQSVITVGPAADQTIIPAQDRIGTRLWTTQQEELVVSYSAQVTISRADPDFSALPATSLPDLPGEAVPFLFSSPYCSAHAFDQLVTDEFADLAGGPLIAAMSDHIGRIMTYGSDSDNAHTNAEQSYAARKGVCRDYAHILIAMARTANIPARFVSTYAPDVTPQDFHAVVEVYLQGDWHLIDATGMAKPEEIVRICVGRDAADASFLTSYGGVELQEQTVQVARKMS